MTPSEVEFLYDESGLKHIVPSGESNLHTTEGDFDGDDLVWECECKPVGINILPDDFAVIHNPLL